MNPVDWLNAVRQNGGTSPIPPEPREPEFAEPIEKPCNHPETPCDSLYIIEEEGNLEQDEKFCLDKETERFSGGDKGTRGNHARNEPERDWVHQGDRDEPVRLSADQEPWVGVAERVLAHEFEHADDSTIESVTIGLRGIPHPICQKALARLRPNKEKPR